MEYSTYVSRTVCPQVLIHTIGMLNHPGDPWPFPSKILHLILLTIVLKAISFQPSWIMATIRGYLQWKSPIQRKLSFRNHWTPWLTEAQETQVGVVVSVNYTWVIQSWWKLQVAEWVKQLNNLIAGLGVKISIGWWANPLTMALKSSYLLVCTNYWY